MDIKRHKSLTGKITVQLVLAALMLYGCAGQITNPTTLPTIAVSSSTPVPTAAPSHTPAPATAVPVTPTLVPPTQTAIPAAAELLTIPTAVMPQRPFNTSLYGQTLSNVPYCSTPDGTSQLMDIYYPAQGEPPFPVIIFVHGGSWMEGTKLGGWGILEGTELVSGGNLFISIDYRLAPKYVFPAMIEDVKCAIRSVRANQDSLYADPERIAVMGSSAGGHLVSLAGVAGPEAGWDVGDYPGISSKVNAVVDLYGAITIDRSIDGGSYIARQAFGAKDVDDPIMQKYSPMSYITPDDAPFLVVHGMQDGTVPIVQSEVLVKRLEAAGVPVTFVPIDHLGHDLPRDDRTNPTYEELVRIMRAFLDQTIGREVTP